MFSSRNHWFILWVCLELNTIIIVCLILKYHKQIEISLIYFITQRISSLIIVLAVLESETYTGLWNSTRLKIFTLVLCFKIAIIPFSRWFIRTSLFLQKFPFFLILTLQKYIPFMLLYFSGLFYTWFLIICIIASLIIGPVLNFSQNRIKFLLLISRVSNSGWFLIALSFLFISWKVYFLLYILILIFLISSLHPSIKQTHILNKKQKIFTFISIINLRGIPPFSIFLPKVIVVCSATYYGFWTLASILMIRSILDFFVYLRAVYQTALIQSPSIKWITTTRLRNNTYFRSIFLSRTLIWLLRFFL